MRLLSKILILFMLSSCAESKPAGFLESIGDGIYVHHGEHLDIDVGYQGDICNISVVVGSKGVAVIDTAGSLKVGQQLRAAIAEITKLPILYVINTHVHPDHIFGNAAFTADKPTFVGHEALAEAMQLREEAYNKLNAKYLGEEAKGSEIVLPTLAVKDSLNLDLGDRSLQLQAYPVAHTNTDITVIDSKTQTLFTGDLLFIERTPVIEGDIKGLIATLEQLKTYQDVKQVVPGHGAQTKNWKVAIGNELRYLNVMLSDARTAIENDVGMVKAMDTVAASEKDKWVLFDVANRRNVNTVYPALEWE
ncbi:MAG: quinoprotein relay system zinc metallohydrolase 2 [Betaproteobacteria bacterium]|nr:quinoprotein relay system zinc metallohydrolase 2 [Betaproteobacteria bacterium]